MVAQRVKRKVSLIFKVHARNNNFIRETLVAKLFGAPDSGIRLAVAKDPYDENFDYQVRTRTMC